MNGYACKHCQNGEFHVPTKVIDVEILKLDSEEPVQGNEVGRILITKKSIKDPALNRYEIGDLGKWIHEPCACGHTSPKFKLMGRHGDIVRCGAKFINYREISQLILKNISYTDDIQMVIDNSSSDADHITLRLLESAKGKESAIIELLRENLKDLKLAKSTSTPILNLENHAVPFVTAPPIKTLIYIVPQNLSIALRP